MTSASPSPLLLLVASAALAWSSAEGFIHPPSQTSPLQMQMHHTRHAQHCRLSNQLNLSNSVENDIETATPLNDLPLDVVLASDLNTSLETTIPDTRSEEAKNMLAMEMSEVGPEGIMPFAPMMTFQKFLTMQEKRVKVTIRYSAAAGLRPFYLTVASRIKSTHPDVLLEKRILPPSTNDATESIFEVVVDGKTVIGKKKVKMLKVRASSSSSSSRNDNEDDNTSTKDKNEATDSDIAGGRSIFVSMEKVEQELIKARKRRRPSTMYKSKEDALRSGDGDGDDRRVSGTSEAVLRLERLKAMSSRKN